MEFTWTDDVGEGVLKNHALSSKIYEAAIAQCKVMKFVRPIEGYGRKMGETVTVLRIKNIGEPTSARIGERDRIPIDTFSRSTRAVTVTEFGRGVEYTHKAELLDKYEIEDPIQRKLRQQLQLVLDTEAATAFKAGQINFIPTSLANGTFDTDGTPTATALVNGTVAHVKVIRDYMFDTIHVPGYDGSDRIVCIASTKFLRGIRNDPEFLAWKQGLPEANEAFQKAVVGSIENVDFVEINHTQALSNAKGSGSVLGEAVFFGEDAVAMAVAEDPELRADVHRGDFGRQKAVAWYGVLEFLNIFGDSSTDGEARTVTVTSA